MIETLISSLRKKLPIQNPLHSFVHNNILQVFETSEFHEALFQAGKLYRANSYWPVHRYLEKFEEGKIDHETILKSIDLYSAIYPPIPSYEKIGLTSREYFYRLMFSDLNFNDDEIQSPIRSSELWSFCLGRMEGQSLTLSRKDTKYRGRDYWEKYYKESFALNVHPLIIRLVSSYLDQGMSFWRNPFATKGIWEFFVFDILSTTSFADGWRKTLADKVIEYQSLSPQSIIERILKEKSIPLDAQEEYILEILFDLKGWAGMVNKLELEPWQATVKAPPVKLVEYIAMVLLIEDAIDDYHAGVESIDLSNIHGRVETKELKSYQLSMALYQIAESFKIELSLLRKFSNESLLELIDEIDTSEFKDRVRLWHEAFEYQFHQAAVSAIASHEPDPARENPYAQILFCIDDREESMRRHLEEIDSGIASFGVVGFFGIDMNYSGLRSQRLIAQCPPVVTPRRIVKEVPRSASDTFHKLNNLRGSSDLYLYYHSRTLFRGFLSTIILGLLSLIPMFLQVFFPQLSKVIQKKLDAFILKDPATDIQIEKGHEEGHGYSVDEMASIIQGIFRMCGIEKTFSEMVVLLAHGSSSNNNPFKQAYGCGACGGNAGIPNSRAFAKMANNPEVRAELKKRGLEIPVSTFIISGYHDTCTDEFHFYNAEMVPENLSGKFTKIKDSLTKAAKKNALERCQRFSSFNQGDETQALEHVKERAHDLAQPRPEYGHSSNALAIVGRRDLTKGLFLNRRAFLLSYDWKLDSDGEVLKQVVLGGIPVAVNINMDYYFSSVDNDNYGCGSKLPLNLTSLLGVMTGSQGDLRIGLARQMIEIHEPIRNLTIIEAPIERVESLFKSHDRLKNILFNHWMRLSVKDPLTGKWWTFRNTSFAEMEVPHGELAQFKSSLDLIRSHREIDFAEIKL